MKTNFQRPLRAAVILAGGEGRHLRSFIRALRHKDIPKQYATIIGTRSMLTHTYDRVERLIPEDRVYTVLNSDHLRYPEAKNQIEFRAPHTLVFEPTHRGTGPGILLPLTHIQNNHPGSSVAILPTDHFILQEDLFVRYLEQAFEMVEQTPSLVVFLGVKPGEADPEYDYILPDFKRSAYRDSCSILALEETPEPRMASRLISLGALWNTSVMVFNVASFWDLLRISAPDLHGSFRRIARSLGTPYESVTVEAVYEILKPSDFCKDLIHLCDLYSGNQFSVIPMHSIFWSDWGCPMRILSTLGRLEHKNYTSDTAFPDEIVPQFSFENRAQHLAASP
jgi:mannose-1-phosphate guanylyltransferase